ncbi:TetR/AcrR family transcriptional regulator C-terminal domain-containing protein [Nocardia acidivorans]|uniref:TetR/AcrR family transcriptional regulator C-terminal domain-containing protein n=1 Tax=Nocardia acidivorans TaxID=404580 RepID=UPI0008304983|nr:TetR/AcrR family transcriptional regulator C-terminal domain-containing protein [Nocardia acidivorans]
MTGPPTTHVASKEELLELVVDEVLGEVWIPGEFTADRWRADMLATSRSLRDTLLRHTWLGGVMSSAGLVYLGPDVMRMIEGILAILETAGFDDIVSDPASNAIFSYVMGSSSSEAALLTAAARSGLSEQEWVDRILVLSRAVPAVPAD